MSPATEPQKATGIDRVREVDAGDEPIEVFVDDPGGDELGRDLTLAVVERVPLTLFAAATDHFQQEVCGGLVDLERLLVQTLALLVADGEAERAQCSGPWHQPQGTSASLGAERRAPNRVESSDPDMMG